MMILIVSLFPIFSLLFARLVSTAPAVSLTPRAACDGNFADDRTVWCDDDISTDYYANVPDTGVTVEVGLLLHFLKDTKLKACPVLVRYCEYDSIS